MSDDASQMIALPRGGVMKPRPRPHPTPATTGYDRRARQCTTS